MEAIESALVGYVTIALKHTVANRHKFRALIVGTCDKDPSPFWTFQTRNSIGVNHDATR